MNDLIFGPDPIPWRVSYRSNRSLDWLRSLITNSNLSDCTTGSSAASRPWEWHRLRLGAARLQCATHSARYRGDSNSALYESRSTNRNLSSYSTKMW